MHDKTLSQSLMRGGTFAANEVTREAVESRELGAERSSKKRRRRDGAKAASNAEGRPKGLDDERRSRWGTMRWPLAK